MDQSLWQTIISFDFLYSSYMWMQTILLCGKHCQTIKAGTVSRHWFRGRSWRFEVHFWMNTVHFWSHTFVPLSWMCKKQTAVSHSSTESEIISLDAGLRLDELPAALELLYLIVSVFGSMTQTTERTVRPVDTERREKSQGKINVLNHIDCVPSNVHSSHQEALLCVRRQWSSDQNDH